MRALVLSLVAVTAALAQTRANPDNLPAAWRTFERPAADRKLQCRIRSIKPQLNLGFRFQTGYTAEIPLKQYSGPGHWWSAVLRVTPEASERQPVWLVSRIHIPPVPKTNARADVGGAFVVGEGKYRVDMLLVDDSNRACVAGWNIRARLGRKARDVRPGLPPGAVDDISLRRWGRMSDSSEERRHKVSILMHAAAAVPGRVRLRNNDRLLLMSALTSMLDRLSVRKARLTIFSMDRQEELYHTEELSRRSFREAVDALNGLELGIVDYSTLQNRGGHVNLLADLLNRELAAKDPPDAVIFLGPLARWTGRVDESSLPERAANRPVYYVQLRPWRVASSVQADAITRTVRELGGRTKPVYSPEDFAEALKDLQRLLNPQER